MTKHMPISTNQRSEITGLILAGGLGRRMGQQDKGWVLFQNRPMIEHVLNRICPQVNSVIINANRNQDRYAALGHEVISDVIEGFSGPLAGWHAALLATKTPWVVSVPCDSPRLPEDLVARLYQGAQEKESQIAIARTNGRAHPVFALFHRDLLPQLTQYIESGERKVETWCRMQSAIEVAFDDQPEAFDNINTENDLKNLTKNI